MNTIRSFTVVPTLPAALEPLRKLAYNLWWSWSHDAVELFRRLDRTLWVRTKQNPVLLLGRVSQERLEALLDDEGFISHMDRVVAALDKYMQEKTWYQRWSGYEEDMRVGYFSAEYGIADCLPIFSGGLGVLSGDHLKSASDLGLPLVAVGLLYRQGYFRQYLNADGWQQERYPELDFYNMPLEPVRSANDARLMVRVDVGGSQVACRVWRVQVGRVPLYLLDTDFEANPHDVRAITGQLYGGGEEMRIRQEIVLGVGGVHALHAMDIHPSVYHMNEGHSAFLAIERARRAMTKHGLDFAGAQEATAAGNVFTTHTPVAAGNDRFSPDLIRRYLGAFPGKLGISWDEFLGLGREDPADGKESFCMTVLAIRMADHVNGVSQLHGDVSRRMWRRIWPGIPDEEVPIQAITNGIHTPTWISRDMRGLLERYLGPRWSSDIDDATVWERVQNIPDEELWRTHERRRERLVAFSRRALRRQLARRGATPLEQRLADEVLDPEALTIGFARRFAPYKRATLLFRDIDRLIAILDDRDRPVQLIFAGKAHPADDRGKAFIREIVHKARHPRLRRRVVFLEDYDMGVARYLVSGVDVWLNNPRRPLEASGTSGMKSSANGALNVSVLDGWWVEAYDSAMGWAIGGGEEYTDVDLQDAVECNALYDLLEKEIVPLFYRHSHGHLPREWIARMKASMGSICPVFNTNRMVGEYLSRSYRPAHRRVATLYADGMARARALADWTRRVRAAWDRVQVVKLSEPASGTLGVGAQLAVEADVQLGSLTPDDVTVELYVGHLGPDDRLHESRVTPMESRSANGDGVYTFSGSIACRTSGRHGFTVRILPRHEDLSHAFEPYLIRWA